MRPTPILDDVITGARLLMQLPGYLRRPLSLPEAHAILRRRLARRECDFLELARRTIFARRASPYLALLRHAGCEYGDVERLVRQDGVEGALRTLCRQGVYLTVDEFKGRRPVARGSVTIELDPVSLRNPLARPAIQGATSGSRGGGMPVPLDLASIRDRAVNTYLTLEARGGTHWRNAVWAAPGFAPILWYSACGRPTSRWFSQLDPATPGLQLRYRWSAPAVRWISRAVGVSFPRIEHVPLTAPLPIARWMGQVLRHGEVPHLFGFPSSVIRLCHAAEEAGLDLTGAQFTITGEPTTHARLTAIRRTGADAVPDYGSADSGGSMTFGCLRPEQPDEVHFFQDLHALVQADATVHPTGTLLVSSLRSTAPFVLLNVSMGDHAVVTERQCGCPLEALGWRTHLHTIRSHEKLTAGGMTFIDTDVIRVLEETLPRRFGGGATDYQLVEDEARDGHPHLRLLVAPSVGPIDPRAVADAFLAAIGSGSASNQVMALQWRQAGLLHVERRPPLPARSGKILHLQATSSRRDGPATPSRPAPGQ